MMLWSVFCIFCAINTVMVYGDFLLIAQFNSFNNPTNRLLNGDCCECCEMEGSCNVSCDIRLQVCIRPADTNHSDIMCPILGLYGDVSPRLSKWLINGDWPGSIQLYVRATHTIGSQDQSIYLTDDLLIDNFYIEIGNINSSSPLTPAQLFTGVGGIMEAELQFEVNCSSNYYGSHCDVECQERNDSLGHYLCNSDGSKECLEGYENVETNCIECIAADGCSPSGGYCLVPGDCICKDGYSGENCSLVVTIDPELNNRATPSSTINYATSSPSINPELNNRATPSSTINYATSSPSNSESMIIVLLPTVGGVIPASASTTATNNIHLPLYIVAAVGGLLVLLMLVVCIISLFVLPLRRRRVYEITTTSNKTTTQNDENHLLDSTTSSTYQIENDTDATFTTFRNGNNNSEQTLHRELHVFYHHNTPELPSREDEDDNEEDRAVESIEMEFPSGYTEPWPDEANENHLQWSSVRSDGSEYLSKSDYFSKSTGSNSAVNSAFNDYQLN